MEMNKGKASSSRQVLSFFCGAGGMDLGFAQAGYEIIFAADYDEAAIATHTRNCPTGVARKIDLSSATSASVVTELNKSCERPMPIGIIGGPPCQGFSRANTKRSNQDPRNELATSYAKLVIELAKIYPIDFVVLENVPELLAEENKNTYKKLVETLGECFDVKTSCLNAANFGVPQSRERVFIVGMRRSVKRKASFAFPDKTKDKKNTVRDAIEALPDPAFFHRDLTPEKISHHPNHWTMRPKSSRFGPNLVTTGRSFIRLDWDKPSRTVAYGNREIHVHPTGMRRLSIYEAMLLQGFPSWYQLTGNLSQQVTQVSNAVPPPVAHAIAGRIWAAAPIDTTL